MSDTSTYKKITLSSTILLIPLKNIKNMTKGDTCANKNITNSGTKGVKYLHQI